MNNILIVEDDRNIVKTLEEYLTMEGFTTAHLSGEKEVEKLLERRDAPGSEAFYPDILLVDILISQGNGFEVCRMAKQKDLPVIFLTASGDENNVVKGLDLGADDYIAKPFRPRELVSRIRSVLRRYGKKEDKIVALGSIVLDPERGTVTKNGSEVSLTALEYRILLAFANERGRLLSRNRLLEEIWDAGGDFVNDNTLTVYIKRLREKIEDDPTDPKIIKTVRGLGYRAE